MSRREYFDQLNVDYAPIDEAKSVALQRELGGMPIAVTLKGIYRIFHNGLPHYFVRLECATDFYRDIASRKGDN